MATLSDFYKAPEGEPQAFALGDIQNERNTATSQAGLQSSRLLSALQGRTLPRLASSEGAAGRFYSGGAQQRASWAGEDARQQAENIQLELQRKMDDLRRRAFMANLGYF